MEGNFKSKNLATLAQMTKSQLPQPKGGQDVWQVVNKKNTHNISLSSTPSSSS